MGGIMTAAGALLDVMTVLTTGSDSKDIHEKLKSMKKATKLLRYDGSMVKLLQEFIIEPVMIATKDAKTTEIFDKLLETNLDIFTSFYLQAFKILQNIHGLSADNTIAVLSTDRNPYQVIGAGIKAGSKLYGLLNRESADIDYVDMLHTDGARIKLSTEDVGISSKQDGIRTGIGGTDLKNVVSDSSSLSSVLIRNLEFGAKFKTKDGKDVVMSLPIIVKARIVVTDIDNIVNLIEPTNKYKSFSWRLDEYRSGAISLTDLLFASDLIAQYKKNRIKDKDGLLDMMNARRMSAYTKLADQNSMGFEKYYNSLIITTADKIKLDRQMGGNITNEAIKQDLLESTLALDLSIIDTDYERVGIYVKDIRGGTDVGFKTLNRRNDKNAGPGMEEMCRMLLMGKPLVF